MRRVFNSLDGSTGRRRLYLGPEGDPVIVAATVVQNPTAPPATSAGTSAAPLSSATAAPAGSAAAAANSLMDTARKYWTQARASKWFWPVVILGLLFVFRKNLPKLKF